MTPERTARDLVDLRKLQLCAAALAYAGEETAFDLMVAASRYAEAVRKLREAQRRKEVQA